MQGQLKWHTLLMMEGWNVKPWIKSKNFRFNSDAQLDGENVDNTLEVLDIAQVN